MQSLIGKTIVSRLILARKTPVAALAPVDVTQNFSSMAPKRKAKVEAPTSTASAVAANGRTSPRRSKSTSIAANGVDQSNRGIEKRQKTAKSSTLEKAKAKAQEAVEELVTSSPSPAKKGKGKAKASSDTHEIEAEPSTPSKKGRKSKLEADSAPNGEKEIESLSAPVPRSKTDYETAEGIPRNMTIPDPLTLDHAPKPSGSSRIASWNILSLKSCMSKGFTRYVEAEDADVLILTETKCNEVPMIPQLKDKYPHQTWGIGTKKGYAGTALLSKTKPIKVTIGLSNSDADTKGRIITAEYERYIICGTYVVNAGEGLKTLPQKVQWQESFAKHLAECDARKPTIWTGDLNVVLDPRDLSKASQKWNKSAGYTATECNHHRRVLAGTAVEGAKPYVDIWRERNPDAVGHFTYYGFRGFCREKGIGWRLDSFIVPERMQAEVLNVGIRQSVYGASDHVPIFMDVKGTL